VVRTASVLSLSVAMLSHAFVRDALGKLVGGSPDQERGCFDLDREVRDGEVDRMVLDGGAWCDRGTLDPGGGKRTSLIFVR
jgi:hypothetical protein